MLPYQDRYLQNVREIAALFGEQKHSSEQQLRMAELRKENNHLLNHFLFPALDELYNATAETLSGLEKFAGSLMDWSSNLDCGLYLTIHEALLRLFRFRRDRNRVIKELYMVGMGLYYQSRSLQGISSAEVSAFHFRNEMVFTEAGSYLKFFEEIRDEETRGYIIRSLANIAICSEDLRKRVAISARVLKIVQDDYYRSLSPALPWDVFLRRTHQQMSSNRAVLSKGNLTAGELAAVLESCEEVFRPEEETDTPNIRWLWPYYEMEYSCGFADLSTTLKRMERLISAASPEQTDYSGLYANVQLPVYYGTLMRSNPSLREKPGHVRFLAYAYEKMLRTLQNVHTEQFSDFFIYNICLVITDYYEMDGVPAYREVTAQLMKQLGGPLYIRSLCTGTLMRVFSSAVFDRDPEFFDDIEWLQAIRNTSEKRRTLEDFAEQCGLYHDFGLIKMTFERICQTRELFETEQQLYELHTISGYDDLAARPSTARYADIALGHHRWYNGAGGYPKQYLRNNSPYRQMTDLCSICSFLAEKGHAHFDDAIAEVLSLEGKRFSPLLTAVLAEPEVKEQLREVLDAN